MAAKCKYSFEPSIWEDERELQSPLSETWHCSRDSYENSDYCLFHLPDKKRKDVSQSDFRTAFLKEINSTGEEKKRFVGVSIPTLDLQAEEIQSDDRHPVQFLHSQIKYFDISSVEIRQPFHFVMSEIDSVNAEEANINSKFRIINCLLGTVDFSSSNFSASFYLRDSVVEDKSDFIFCEFDKAYINDSEFKSKAVFNNTSFQEAHFARSDFYSKSSFDWMYAGGRTHFSECTFSSEASFNYCEFEKDTRYWKTHFKDSVSFSFSKFDEFAGQDLKATSSINFDHVVFTGTVNFTPEDCTLLANANFQNAEFHSETLFHSVIFTGTTDFRSCEFEDLVVMNDSNFCAEADFNRSSFKHIFQAYRCYFREECSFNNSAFDDQSIFNGSHFSSHASFKEATIHEGLFEDVTFETGPTFQSARFSKTLYFNLTPVDNQILIDLSRSHIEGGLIVHPQEYYALYDLSLATLGDIDLEGNSENLLGPLQFSETKFAGFDFKRYRKDLDDIGWEISRIKVDESKLESHVVTGDEELDDTIEGTSFKKPKATQTYPDMARPLEYLENTYMLAKNGAKKVGDNKSESEFLIHEMKAKKVRYYNEIFSSLPTLIVLREPGLIFRISDIMDLPHQPKQAAKAFKRWLINLLLQYSCGYGERLSYVLIWSIVVIVLWAVLFPITGGITNGSEPTISYSSFDNGETKLTKLVITALYFSVVTFTTLGYGDYHPVGGTAQLLASAESLLGAILVALFIFVLGRRVSR